MLRMLVIEAAAGFPGLAVIAVIGQAAGGFEHVGEVHQIPAHDGRVALGEVIVETGAVIAITGTGAGFTDPAAISLGRDDITEMAESVEDGQSLIHI